MDLETARAVVDAHRQAEQEKHVERQRAMVGRCFKYRNSYSSSERWWLYAIVRSVDECGHLLGLSFQHTSSGEIQIDRRKYLGISIDSGWNEIEATEFWNEARSVSAIVMAELADGTEHALEA